jgi:hypothetical protein
LAISEARAEADKAPAEYSEALRRKDLLVYMMGGFIWKFSFNIFSAGHTPMAKNL